MGKQEANDHILQPLKEQDVVSRVNREASTDSLFIAQRGQATPFHQRQSALPVQESHSADVLGRANITSFITGRTESHPASASGLSTSTSLSSAWIALPSHIGSSAGVSSSFGPLMNNVSGSIETSKERRHQPLGPPSPSRQSLQQRLPSPSSSASSPYNSQEHLQAQAFPHPGLKSSQLVGQLNRISHQPNNQDPFPILPHDHHMLGTLQNLQNPQLNQSQPHQLIQTSSSLLSSSQLRHHGPFSTSSSQAQKPLPLSLVFGTSQAMGHSALSHSNNPVVDVSGSSSTSSLLAAIMSSGVLSNNSIAGSLPNLSFQEVGALSAPSNIQLPLPGGPPPTKSLASRAAPTSVFCSSSPGDTLASTAHPQGTEARPPLPTGPPPPSSTVDSMSSQASSASGDASNPFSSLLSSLVAKGLISASMKESPTADPLQLSTGIQNQSSSISDTSSLLLDISPVSSTLIASSGNNLPMSESQSATELPQGTAAEMGLIGIEFKPDIIREVHTSVIRSLFDDLPHCCSLCGFRLRHQEGLDKHLEWHASKEPEPSSLSKMSRRWYTNLGDWISGSVGLSFQPTSSAPVEVSVKASEKSIPMIPADESQCLCTICGELFEDFYSYERDEWMFKGAVYMDILAGKTIQGATDISASQDPIVHASCILQNSIYDLGLAEHVKVEESTGA